MTTMHPIDRDERTSAVENAGYRWAFMFLSFALLADVAGRSFLRREPSWDLLLLVIVGGGIATLYQTCKRALPGRWLVTAAIAVGLAAVVGVIGSALR
jgi:hypothetical protein